MPPTSDQIPYTNTRVILHWLSAAVIIWASITGFWSSCLTKQSVVRHVFEVVNPQLTALLIPFFGWRMVLYLRSYPWRAWPKAMLQDRMALLVHGVLYITISLVLLTGLMMMPSPWAFLGILPIPTLGFWHNQLFFMHKEACVGLVGLIAIHLLAVCYHLFKKHPTLSKMYLNSNKYLNIKN